MAITKNLVVLFCLFLFSSIFQAQDNGDTLLKKDGTKLSPLELNNRRARRHISTGEYEKATTFVKKSLEIDPKDIDAHYILAEILVKTEKFDQAHSEINIVYPKKEFDQLIFLIEKSLEVSPSSKKLREQAIAWSIEAKALKKENHWWYEYLFANSYFRNNELEKSLELIKPIIEKEPKNTMLNLLLGNIYTKKGEYEIAAGYLAKGMDRKPNKAWCHNHISYQLLTYDEETDNRPIIALSYAILASDETKQKIPDIEDTLALAYFKTGDFKNAKSAQERAVKLLRDELPPEQKDRSTKLMGFKKQLLVYEEALKKL